MIILIVDSYIENIKSVATVTQNNLTQTFDVGGRVIFLSLIIMPHPTQRSIRPSSYSLRCYIRQTVVSEHPSTPHPCPPLPRHLRFQRKIPPLAAVDTPPSFMDAFKLREGGNLMMILKPISLHYRLSDEN